MAETLGMLCDKLTIIKLKQYHTEDSLKLESLNSQCIQLQSEIDEYVSDAISGKIPTSKMVFVSNKVYKSEGNEVREIFGQIGQVFSQLADVNCKLWHEQEKVYEFEKVPSDLKNMVVKQLAILNLERNKCIDAINNAFASFVLNR